MFNVNVGPADQVIRIGIGLLLLLLAGAQAIGPWGVMGLVPLVTGLVRFCPVYKLLGIKPSHRREEP